MDIMIIQIVQGTGFAEVENYSSSSNFNALALAIGRMIDNVEHLASIRATVYPFVSHGNTEKTASRSIKSMTSQRNIPRYGWGVACTDQHEKLLLSHFPGFSEKGGRDPENSTCAWQQYECLETRTPYSRTDYSIRCEKGYDGCEVGWCCPTEHFGHMKTLSQESVAD